MKTQYYLTLLLILIFSSKSLAIKVNQLTLEKVRMEQVTKKKKEPVGKFFQKTLRRILKKKIARKLERKNLKNESNQKPNSGKLSIMLSILGLVTMFVLSNEILIILGVLFGLAGFIIGLRGIKREEKKAMSIIGMILGTAAIIPIVLVMIFIISFRIF